MIFIEEAFLSGCISKVINDSKDYSWTKIKRAINDRNDYNLSTKIYRLIEDTLNIVTDKKFKGTDVLYEAMERIFNEFRDNGGTIESVNVGLRLFNSNASIERCEYFFEKFYEGICQNEELYKIISLLLQEKEIEINQEEFRQLNEKIERNHAELSNKMDGLAYSLTDSNSINKESIITKDFKFQNNKKQDYIKNWNSRLFLHLDNNEKPLTLSDAYIMPECGYRMTLKINDLPEDDSLESLIYKFINYEKSSNMLIIGVPGAGKSTVVSWIANQYRDDDTCIVLRFRDWESKELRKGLLKSICNTLKCKRIDLENKVLVLDGFDEMKALDIRMKILNIFLSDIKDFQNFKCIITSRSAYIDASCFYNKIIILAFDIDRIERFYEKITGEKLRGVISDDQNLDVLGVPVILYMAIMSNIDITKKSSKPELYGRIFAENGGIFDRFCEYDSGSQVLRNSENIKKHLEFLRDVAISMFKKNTLQINKDECIIPKLETQGKKVSILEFPIKHLFENTNPNIEFIHKSIYEYFVAECIITSIIESEGKDIKDFAGILGKILKDNILSEEIIEFLKYKTYKTKLGNMFKDVENTFNLMLRDGMTYYTYQHYKKVHIYERNVFINMLEIIHLWGVSSIKVDPKISDYLKYKENNLNLEGIDLREVNLTGTYLRCANLKRVNLSRENIFNNSIENSDEESVDFNLDGIDLAGSDLTGADLRGRNIEQIDFKDVIIKDVIFDEKQISYLESKYVLNNTKVCIKETREIILYQEYKKRGKENKNLFITINSDDI